MGKAAGFALILAGVGTAAYVIPSFDSRDRAAERRASDVAAITTASVPGRAVENRTAEMGSSAGKTSAEKTTATKTEPLKIASGSASERSDQRLTLTKDIQRELHRVGCYSGDIDGEWTPQTRQAMKTFVDRVNATLPVDTPDHILRTLVSGHPGEACGKVCPSGQAMANGRCTPAGLQANAPASRAADVRRQAKEVARASRPAAAPIETGKPKDKPTEAVVSSWAPTVVPSSALPQVAPSAPAASTSATAAIPSDSSSASRPDLSGRMSVGVGASSDAAQRSITAEAPPPAVVAPAPRPATKIVIKKREGTVANAPVAPTGPAATPGQSAPNFGAAESASAKNGQSEPRQKTAAIEADEPALPGAEPVTVGPSPRSSNKRATHRLPQDVYRGQPPARFVGVYVSPPVYRERFGPSIFKRLERDAR